MNDIDMKQLICNYVHVEMDILSSVDDIGDHISYSRAFNRKMKRVRKAGNYFGGRLALYTVFSRAAAIILIVLSLAVANQTSAALFGFNPWKEMISLFMPESKTWQKRYKMDETSQGLARAIGDEPFYLPDGYVQKERLSTAQSLVISWERQKNDNGYDWINYSRAVISENITTVEDAEYLDLITTSISGYAAKIFIKEDSARIIWNDSKYHYFIHTSDMNSPEIMLKRMAESIYQKK